MSIRKKLESVSVSNISDIRNAILPFIKDISEKKVDIEGKITWTDEGGQKMETNVESYSSDVSMRKGLLDGFEQVKQYNKMWGRIHTALEEDEYGAVLPEFNIDKVSLPVDRIIKHRLGGHREGMTVVWILNDRKVVFDPYSKKLQELHNHD